VVLKKLCLVRLRVIRLARARTIDYERLQRTESQLQRSNSTFHGDVYRIPIDGKINKSRVATQESIKMDGIATVSYDKGVWITKVALNASARAEAINIKDLDAPPLTIQCSDCVCKRIITRRSHDQDSFPGHRIEPVSG
jgi:hypothetical protein